MMMLYNIVNIFQETRVCERVDEVDCTKSEKFYYLNLELYGNTMIPAPEGKCTTEYYVLLDLPCKG